MVKVSDKLQGISRRDLLRLTKHFGISSTLLAAGGADGRCLLFASRGSCQLNLRETLQGRGQAHAQIRRRGLQREEPADRAGRLPAMGERPGRAHRRSNPRRVYRQQPDLRSAQLREENSAGHRRHLCGLNPEFSRRRALSERTGLRLYVPVQGVAILLPVSPGEPEGPARPDAQAPQGRVPVQPRGVARHPAWPEVEGQAAGEERNRVGRNQEPRYRHAAWPHRHEPDEPEPDPDCLVGDPRRSQAGPSSTAPRHGRRLLPTRICRRWSPRSSIWNSSAVRNTPR